MEYATLSNGIKMPMLGYGVYQIPEADTERCVLDAISCGYRSLDTAQAYHNEEGVGNAIEKSGVPREELFITTKIWIANAGYEKAKASIAESLRKLKTSYIDLLLIHQPFSDYYGTWRAMEEAYKNGQLRAIGVANFYPDRLIDLCQFAEIAPMVNQVETHVFQQQQTAHAVQLARTKVDGKITIRYLPGQQVAHRVIILEVAVHDLVPDLIIGGKTAHCGKPGQHQQQKQPRCCAFELLFCCLHQR